MQDRHRRHKTTSIRNQSTALSLPVYTSHENPQQYAHSLLAKACAQLGYSAAKMNVRELGSAVGELGIRLRDKEVHQLFLYATYQPGIGAKQAERKVASVVTLCAAQVDMKAVAKWITRKIDQKKISLQADNPQDNRIRMRTQNTQSCSIKAQPESKLPVIKSKPAKIFTTEVSKVIGIFSEMEQQRQNAGLEPVCLSEDQKDDRDMPVKQIHYEGDFFEVNEKLNKLRSQAERRIEKVIQAAKNDKKLKQKFQQALMRYQRVRTEANQKIGKCGAMKAQKRMVERRRAEVAQLERWRETTNQTQFSTKYY